MLAISIALIVSMLVARTSILSKINEIKSSAGTKVTITPAGIQGFAGGGDPLSADQVTKIASTGHISSTVSILTDQLGTDDTNLTPSLELGSFGQRQQRFESENSSSKTRSESSSTLERPKMTPRTTITGTTDPDSVSTTGGSLTLTSGQTINVSSSDAIALIGSSLSTKNNLSVGSTFTAYGTTFTIKGIYQTGNKFQDSGVIVPLATLQKLTDQSGAVTSVTALVDSSDNVTGVVSNLKSSLGDKVDVTSEIEQANQSVSSLESIASLALGGVIGASVAGAVIILLTMIMIVRERRREIGVIKAIGGTNRSVIGQFMTESLTLTFIGGVVGLVLGVAVSGPMTSSLVKNSESSTSTTRQSGMPRGSGGPAERQLRQTIGDITSNASPATFAAAVGIMFLIAVLGSALPAWVVANIKPAEVLRSE
jgi:putative ABC transport system permease protein